MTPTNKLWHWTYRRWHDADRAGRRRAAAAWGAVADTICRTAWR